jgi:hypothetical protein
MLYRECSDIHRNEFSSVASILINALASFIPLCGLFHDSAQEGRRKGAEKNMITYVNKIVSHER